MMIRPDDFYSSQDGPSHEERTNVWDTVRSALPVASGASWYTFERRSFLYGMAAALVLMFASVGVYTTVRELIERAQPPAIQIDRAYQSAIDEFQEVASRYPLRLAASDGESDLVRARQEQLRVLESAISALRTEMSGRDLSPLLRANLRDLYAKKLALLQTMVEQGDIEL